MANTNLAKEFLAGLKAATEALEAAENAEARQKRAEETVKSLSAKSAELAHKVAELEEVKAGEAEIRAKAHQARQQCEAEIAAIQKQHGADKARLKEEAVSLNFETQKIRDAFQVAQGELQRLDQQIAERKATLAKLVA